MKNVIIIIYATAFFLGIGFSACDQVAGEKAPETEVKKSAAETAEDSMPVAVTITKAQFENAKVKLGFFQKRALPDIIKATGYIEVPPQNYAQVSTYIGAVVKSVYVQEGDYVKRGQTVLTLEHPDLIKLQQEYIEGKNHLEYLQKEYERHKELFENKVSSGKAFQEAESKYNAEKGKVESLKSQLAMLSVSALDLDNGKIQKIIKLKAPISGFIGKLNVSQGAYAEPNKTLFDITDNTDLIAHLDIFEKDIPRVKTGQKVFIYVPNQEAGKTQGIEAEIYLVGKSVDYTDKTVSVRAKITDPRKHGLIPGMFVSGEINVPGKVTQALPVDAVVRAGKKEYVFMATDEWCLNPHANNGNSSVSIPKTNIAEDSISLSYKMVEVKTSKASNGYVGVIPAEQISDSTVMAVKGAFYLVSQLKSGETVGCCAPEEPETRK